MRNRNRIIAAVGLLLAAACQAPTQEARDVNGRVVGDATRRPVDDGVSMIQLPDELGQPTKRTNRKLADRSDELVEFRGGVLQYQRVHYGGFLLRSPDDHLNRMLTEDVYRRGGFPEKVGPLRGGKRAGENYQFALVEGTTLRCVLIEQFMRVNVGDGIPTESPGNAELRGVICESKSTRGVDEFEARSLRAFEKVRIGASRGI